MELAKLQKHGTGGHQMSDDLIRRKELLEEIKSFRCTLTGLRNAKGIIARAADEYKKSILKIIEEQPAAVKAENR